MVKSKTLCITRHEWRLVTSASPSDFKLLVANEAWQVLDKLADKVRRYSEEFEPSDNQMEFLGLYDWLTEYIDANGNLPQSCVELVRGKSVDGEPSQ